jgi:hypothetical protein
MIDAVSIFETSCHRLLDCQKDEILAIDRLNQMKALLLSTILSVWFPKIRRVS